jgi:uncharacterized repeat protein (TIGR03803 family)
MSSIFVCLHVFAQDSNPGVATTTNSTASLYGVAQGGFGLIYKVDRTGNETVLYSFAEGAAGYAPAGVLVADSAGDLYGTTIYGGLPVFGGGYGTVFKLDSAGNETVLHNFTNLDGAYPFGIIRDSDGNLYGTTSDGGGPWVGSSVCARLAGKR